MIPLNIKLEDSKGITLLSNTFIDQYMRDANDAQIKIYLYLLRMVSANLPTDISEIADKFNHTEKDVIRSLKYWDNLGLISLSYDDNNNIAGVTFKNASGSVSSANPVKKTVTESPVSKEIPMISMDYAAERESYSLDDIKRLSSDPEVKMLLNAASQYFGRPLNPTEIRTILFIHDRLNFSIDLTDYLIEYSVSHDQKNIHYIESIAINWYEQGIDTLSKAKQNTKKTDKSVISVMKALGKDGTPATNELEYIKKWLFTYNFPLSIIEEACQRTVLATDRNRFQYADSILKNWHTSGVHSKKDIVKLDEEYASSKQAKTSNNSNNSNNSAAPKSYSKTSSNFLKMEQQDYDFEAIEKALTK